ncbi:MAG: GIY-YIG nuclease family protein, partial [Candidatus Marinimicrobia bacterium]|nr:GIY-YIG nuclease family protein [Candidatus Neomarinimicrobiota bacterium]
GYSSDLSNRLKAHNSGKVRSTKSYKPFNIIYTEEFSDKSFAIKQEMNLKSSAGNIWIREKLKLEGLW